MHRFAAAVLMLIPLGGPFVNATAAAERVGDQLEVELIVEIDQGATALIAHVVVGGDEPQPAVSLDARANRTFGGFVTLPVQDAVIVFELLRPDGGRLSAPTTLSELGIDIAALGGRTVSSISRVDDPPEGLNREAKRWLWLAIAFGAAALSALAFWARGEKEPDRAEEVDPDPTTHDHSASSTEP